MKHLVCVALVVSTPAFAQIDHSGRSDPGGVAVSQKTETLCVAPEVQEHGMTFFNCGGRPVFVRNAYKLGHIEPGQEFLCMVGNNAAGGKVAEDCQRKQAGSKI